MRYVVSLENHQQDAMKNNGCQLIDLFVRYFSMLYLKIQSQRRTKSSGIKYGRERTKLM